MEKLRSLATAITFVKRMTSKGPTEIENLIIPFTDLHLHKDSPKRLDRNSSKTHRSKPLYRVEDEVLYGELAVLRLLEKDGWKGVWMDTFHNRGRRKNFWSGMPPKGMRALDDHADELYHRIIAKNQERSSGFFDIFVWRGDNEYAFLECKRKDERPNKNELRWIEAALATGLVKVNQLHFVTIVDD